MRPAAALNISRGEFLWKKTACWRNFGYKNELHNLSLQKLLTYRKLPSANMNAALRSRILTWLFQCQTTSAFPLICLSVAFAPCRRSYARCKAVANKKRILHTFLSSSFSFLFCATAHANGAPIHSSGRRLHFIYFNNAARSSASAPSDESAGFYCCKAATKAEMIFVCHAPANRRHSPFGTIHSTCSIPPQKSSAGESSGSR